MFKILLADDNKEYVELLESFLNGKEDLDVVGIARDGWECLEKIQSLKPDLVLLDLVMPRLDGMGVLERLQSEKNYQPRVMMLSAMANESMIQRAMMRGAVDYLMKPFELEGIYSRIRDICLYTLSGMPKMDGNLALAEPSGYALPFGMPAERKPLEVEVTRLLHDMGVPAHVKGYLYLRDAILMILDNVQYMSRITKEIYPRIASKYDTSPNRVERAIRHAIELAWSRGNVDMMIEYFGYTINMDKGRPTNSEFIAMVSDRIRLHY